MFRGVEYQRRLDSGEQREFISPPTDFIPYHLRKIIVGADGTVDRRLWELALHDRLAQALQAGDVWVEHSTDHAPLGQDIRVPAEARADFLRRNPHLASAEAFVAQMRAIYLETARRANSLWPGLEDVGFESGVLWVGRLKVQVEPDGMDLTRQRLDSLIPRRKLAQIFREVLHWVDYLAPLREAAGRDIRIDDLDERLLAVIMGEGCNIGLANMAEATSGLSYIQLARVAGRCLNDNALEKAIARLINFYDALPIVKVWGDGTWSSADGKLVPTPVKTLYARLHPKAPKGKRLVNYFTYVYDRLMPYWGKVIETTARESIHEIDGLLHNEADLHPRKQATDTAGYTDNVFGLASLLSIFYAPRIKDLADQRLFYFDKEDKKTFAHISRLLVAKINTHLIKAQWDKVIELVVAVEQGLAPGARVLRKLQAAGEHHDLYRALQEIGRIAKTIYLLSYLTSPALRREVERQLNKGENYHSLAETIAWGNKGEVRLRDLQALLNRASCLRLVASIVILFNAAYLQAAADKWRVAGVEIPEAHLAHIFPTSTGRINFLGDYSFRDEAALATLIHQLPVAEPDAEQLELVVRG